MSDKNTKKQIIAYPTSYIQKRIWFLEKMEKGRIKNNIGIVSSFSGVARVEDLRNIFQKIIDRHEILRTNFYETESEELVQAVHKNQAVDFSYFDLRLDKDKLRKKGEIIEELKEKSFDLAEDKLIRFALIGLADDQQVVVIVGHHIIIDSWSMSVIANEFFHLAQAFFYKKPSDLPDLSIQYKDYAAWEQSEEFKNKSKESEKYWLEKLDRKLPVLDLPIDKPRPFLQNYDIEIETIEIKGEHKKIVDHLCRKYDVTIFVLFYVFLNIILQKLSGQAEILIGTYVANRDLPELDGVVGPLINSLVLSSQLEEKQTFSEFLLQTKERILLDLKHREYPFEKLVEKLNPNRNIGRAPIFSTVFQVFNSGGNNGIKNNIFFERTKEYQTFDKTLGQFDLSFHLHTRDDDYLLALTYNRELFFPQTIRRYLSYFLNLLEDVYGSEHKNIFDLNILSEQDKKLLVKEFNNTDLNLDDTKDIFDIFSEQAVRTPNNIALSCLGEEHTYCELKKRAEKLIIYFQQIGIQDKIRVGLALERGYDFVCVLLALLALGVVIVPINIEEPKSRLEFISKDSNLDFILVDFGENFSWFKNVIKVSNIDVCNQFVSFVKQKSYLQKEAFILYTSGSTGEPKGVLLKQKGFVNYASSLIKFLDISEKENIAQNLSADFVASFWQILVPLFVGAKIVVYPEDISHNVPKLIRMMGKDKVSLWEANATSLTLFVEANLPPENFSPDLKILLTGEETPEFLIEKFYNLYKFPLINAYGQTECSDEVLIYKIPFSQDRKVLLGEPILNTKVFVLDNEMRLKPFGSIGEIYISGDCLASGYLNREEETREKFLPHPFIPGEKIYRSGDLGRRLYNGQIEYVGRVDDQIKIRGRRIELNEIVNVLLKKKGMKQGLAVKSNDSIVLYYIGEDLLPIKIRNYLSEFLPNFMLPNYYIRLEKFLLNKHGKIDRQKLPVPQEKDLPYSLGEDPRDGVEKIVAGVWLKILSLKKVNRDDDFFALGGHSLLALKLLHDLHELGYKISLQDIFRFSRLNELARCCSTAFSRRRILGGIPFTAFGDLIKKNNFIPAALPDEIQLNINIFNKDKFSKSLERIKKMYPNYSFLIKHIVVSSSSELRANNLSTSGEDVIFEIISFRGNNILRVIVNSQKISKENLVDIFWRFQKTYNLILADSDKEKIYTPFFSYPDYYHCLHANFLEKIYYESRNKFYASLPPAYDYFLLPSYVMVDKISRATSDFNAVYLGGKESFISAKKLGVDIDWYQAKNKEEAKKYFQETSNDNLLLLFGNNYFLPSNAYYKNDNFISALKEGRNILPMNLSIFQNINDKIVVSSANLHYFGEIDKDDFWEYWKNFRDFKVVNFVSEFNFSFQAFSIKNIGNLKVHTLDMLYEALEMNAKEFFLNKEFAGNKEMGFEKIIFGKQVFTKFKEDLKLNLVGDGVGDIVILDMLKRISRPQLFLNDLLSDIVNLDDDFSPVLNKLAKIIRKHDSLFERLYKKTKDKKLKYEPNLSFLPSSELYQERFLSIEDKNDIIKLVDILYNDLSAIYQEILGKLKLINK